MTGDSADKELPAGATPYNAQNVAPLLGTVRAGMPMYAEENIEDYIPIRQTDGAKYFWLNIRGDSMNAAGMMMATRSWYVNNRKWKTASCLW